MSRFLFTIRGKTASLYHESINETVENSIIVGFLIKINQKVLNSYLSLVWI